MANHNRNLEKEQFWRLVLDEHRKSGLNVREFCRREAISEPSFFGWRKKIQERDGDAESSAGDQSNDGAAQLVPVAVVDLDRSDLHQEHRQQAAPRNVEIVTPGGCTLRVDPDIDPQRLTALLTGIVGCEAVHRDRFGESAPC